MKYTIELSEEQIRLIAHCLEDISRFASGQCELKYTIEEMLRYVPFEEFIERRNAAQEHLNKIKKILLPLLSDNESLGFDGTVFIGNTYQIYRTILHQLGKYSLPSLSSGNMGTIKIEKSEDKE